jgi:prolipoprotein diacylglyceryl transferase
VDLLAFLPSPSQGTWHLGPVPIRAYALTMIGGILAAGWIGAKRMESRGYKAEKMIDIGLWAVPFGIVGARLYHVFSSPQAYFGAGGNPWKAFAIWEGGLGIWGSIALGAVGGIIGAKRAGVPVGVLADALAPGIAVGQAIGRLGNWFNQELFGAPTTLPWGLQVSDAAALQAGFPAGTLFHPTFLYELLWNLAVAYVLIQAGRRWRWRHGQTFFAYMFLYCLGRVWIEALRVDTASHVLGLRLNVWTSILVGLVGLGLFIWSRRRFRDEAEAEAGADEDADDSGDQAEGETEAEADEDADDSGDSDEPDEPEAGEPAADEPAADEPDEPEADEPAAVSPAG